MDRNEIIVNRDYQRSDKVWPDAAKSYLIESILLGFPVPKFYLNSRTDVKNRKIVNEIVDGQQRSRTIHDFLNDKFPLASTLDTEELHGRTYSTLSEEWQGRFLAYSLSIDRFVGADPAAVRQVFRRMNSYTVPLNPEELRHAENQGPFKWFISGIGTQYSNTLLGLGVFNDKSIVRMQDLKLYTEIAHALDNGVSTTAKKSLDEIYRKYDKEFPKKAEMEGKLHSAFDVISSMTYIKGTEIAKPYQIYSIALAIISVFDELRASQPTGSSGAIAVDHRSLEERFNLLSAALDLPEEEVGRSPYRAFVQASSSRTNVKDQRQKRIDSFKEIIMAAAT